MLSYLFDPFRSGRTDKSRQSKRRRLLRQTRSDQASGRGLSLAATVEQLEDRRLLAFQYLGFSHTNATPGQDDNEAYQYHFEIYNDPATPNLPAVMNMRQSNDFNTLQFDYGTNFSGLVPINLFNKNWGLSCPPAGGSALTNQIGPGTIFSANSFRAALNGNLDTFNLAKIKITCAPGTVDPSFVFQTGDSLPIALEVDFSAAAAGSTSTVSINAPISDTAYAATSFAPSLCSWITSVELKATHIYVQAGITPRYSNNYAATNLIQIENAVTGGLTARVSDGNFVIDPGASVSGNTTVQLGLGVPGNLATSNAYGYGGNGGDILINGELKNAGDVFLQINSLDARNIKTGASGLISGIGTLALYNFGADGGTVDVSTANFQAVNIRAGTAGNQIPDIGITVTQTAGNLVLNSLPTSRGAITLKATAPDAQININANFDTQASLTLDAQVLNITRPLSTTAGDISLLGNTVTIGSNLIAGKSGVGNLNVTSKAGAITLSSAAIIQAPGDRIVMNAKTNIVSTARLEATNLVLTAGGTISAASSVDTVSASAAGSITIADIDELIVTDATTSAGTITISSKGSLEVLSASHTGSGNLVFSATSAGLAVKDLQTKDGSILLTTSSGDIVASGNLVAADLAKTAVNDISMTATTGNILIRSTAIVTAADQLIVYAPSGRIFTPGEVSAVTILSSGSGYTTAPSVSFNPGGGAVTVPVVGDGQITNIKLTSGGSGYTTPPTVTFQNAGTGGSGATATAQVSGGVVTGITIYNRGSTYATAPILVLVGGSGSGAQAVASVSGLTAITVNNPGSGYQVPPQVVISTGEGAGSAAVSTNSLGQITKINISEIGNGFDVPPTVTISDSSGSGFGASAVATLTGGITSATVGTGGTGYSGATTVTFGAASVGGTTATGTATLGITQASIEPIVGAAGGQYYRVGDLLEVVAGSGSQFLIDNSSAGSVTSVSVRNGGQNYTAGDTLYLNGSAGSGLRLIVGSVSAGGVIVSASVIPLFGGTGFANGNILNHVGGIGGRVQVTGVTTPTTGGAITSLQVIAAGSGYTNRPTGVLGGSGNSSFISFNDTAYSVTGVNITSPGRGYPVSSPTVTFSPTTGTAATASAFVSNVVDVITVVNSGQGYNLATTVVDLTAVALGGGASSGPVSVNGLGEITTINLSLPGGGYTAAPAVTILDASRSGSGATATANLSGGVTELVLTSGGSGYSQTLTTVTLSAPAGGGVTATAEAVVGSTGATLGVIQSLRIITPGSGYLLGESVGITISAPGTASGATATAGISNVVTGFTLTSSGSGYNPSTTTVLVRSVGNGATATVNLTGGVTAIEVLSGGSGYTTTLVTLAAPAAGGVRATATAVVAAGEITGFTITNPGSGYARDESPVVTITGGDGLADGESHVSNVIGSLRITNSGAGYDTAHAPTVRLVPFGAQAAATSEIGSGSLTGITIADGGAGYETAPLISIDPPSSGTTAEAVATILAGVVISITITNPGSGYTSTPNISFEGGGGSSASAAALISGVNNVLITNPGVFYAVPPTVTFSSPTVVGGTSATGVAELTGTAQISAGRLRWTALEQPLDSILSTFSRAAIFLTGEGDLIIDRQSGDLILEGASTLNGSIFVTAQKLTLTGAITAGDSNSTRTEDITLAALGGDLIVDAAITAPRTVTLLAESGKITATNLAAVGLITTNNIVLSAFSGATIRSNVQTVRGVVSEENSPLTITETDDLLAGTDLGDLLSTNGVITITVGGLLTVGRIDAGSQGTVSLTASSNIVQGTVDNEPDIVSGTANLISTAGKIDIDTDVDSVSATAPLSTIDLDNTGSRSLTLATIQARNNIRVESVGPMSAVAVGSTLGQIFLTTTGTDTAAPSNILVGDVKAPVGVATIVSTGRVGSNDPLALSIDVTATTARIAAAMDIALRTKLNSISAKAGTGITISEFDAITLGEAAGPAGWNTVKSNNGDITFSAGGSMNAFSVDASSSGLDVGGSVFLKNTVGDITLGNILAETKNGTVSIQAFGSINDTDAAVDITAQSALLYAQTGGIGAASDRLDLSVDAIFANAISDVQIVNSGKSTVTLSGIAALGGDINIAVSGSAVIAGPISAYGAVIGFTPVVNGAGYSQANPPSVTITPSNIADQVTRFQIDQITAGGTGYTAAPLVTFTPAPTGGTTATANAVISGGRVVGLIITNPGSGYTVAPSITLTPAAGDMTGTGAMATAFIGGTQATATANVNSAGRVSGLTSTNTGSGYTSVPIVTIAPGTPTASAIATLGKGTVSLSSNGNVTQSQPITAKSFSLVSTLGTVTLENANNDVDSLAITNGNRAIAFTDKDDLAIGVGAAGITAGATVLKVGGNLTQTQAIVASSLDITATAGTVTLDSIANNTGSLAVRNSQSGQIIGVTTIVGGSGYIVAPTVTFGAAPAGGVTATGVAVLGTGLLTGQVIGITITNSGSGYVTTPTITISAAPASGTNASATAVLGTKRGIAFTNSSALSIGVGAAGITAGATVLKVGGNLTQTQAIVASSLDITATAGTVTLTNSANDVDSIAVVNIGRAVSFTDQDDLAIGVGAAGITAGSTVLKVGSFLTQTKVILATSLDISTTSGAVVLDSDNNVTTLAFTNSQFGQVASVSVSSGSGYAVAPTVTFGAAPVGGTTATGVAVLGTGLQTGRVISVTITNPGSGYITSPNITFSAAPAGGTTATGVAVLSGNISFNNVSGLSIGVGNTGITARDTALVVGGNLTQTKAISATSLSIYATAGTISLSSATNKVATLGIVNSQLGQVASVSVSSGSGYTVAPTVNFGAAPAGGTTAIGVAVLGTGVQVGQVIGITITNPGSGYVIAPTITISAAPAGGTNASATAVLGTKRDIAFTNSSALSIGVGTSGIAGKDVVLSVGGNLSQTVALEADSLAVTNSTGSVVLDAAFNDVASLAVSNGNRQVSFTDKNTLSIGVGSVGIVGGGVDNVVIRSVGTLTVNQSVTSGTVADNDGNILLVSENGDIQINANLTAQNDTITLEAKNGNISQSKSSTIDCETLVWWSKTTPTFSGTLTNTIIAPNITGKGDIFLPGPNSTDHYPGILTVAGATTADGIIIIDADGVNITGLISANTVTVYARTNNISFTDSGEIQTPFTFNGSVLLSAAQNIIDAHVGTDITTASASLTAAAGSIGSALDSLDLSINTITSAAAATGVYLTNNKAVALSSVSSTTGDVFVTAAGTLTATSVIATAGNVNLTASGATSDIVAGSVIASSTTGIAALLAGRSITDGDGNVDITAASASLTATAGSIGSAADSLDLSVDAVTNAAAATGVYLTNDKAVLLPSVSSTTGNVDIRTTAGSIAVGAITATPGVVTLVAAASITDGDALVDITAASASLTAAAGSIGSLADSLDLSVNAVTNAAATTGVYLTNNKAVALSSVSSTTGNVDIRTTAGSIAVGAITAPPGVVTLVAAASITDGDALVDITAASASLTAAAGSIGSLADSLDLSVNTITKAAATTGVYLTNNKAVALSSVSSTTGNVDIRTTAGNIAVGAITATPGVVTLVAAASITDGDALLDITAASASLTATAGSIGSAADSLDLSVNTITKAAAATGVYLTNDKAVALSSVSSTTGNVFVTAAGILTATSVVATGGNVSLTASGATSDIVAGSVIASSTTGIALLLAGRSITDGDALVDITAASASLTATAGSIGSAADSLDLSVNTVTSAAAATGVYLTNDKAVALSSVSSTTGNVFVTAAGILTATSVVATAGNVSLTASGATSDIVAGSIIASSTTGIATLLAGRSITDGDALVDITAASASLTATAGSIGSATDSLDLSVNTITNAAAATGVYLTNNKVTLVSSATATTGAIVLSTPFAVTVNQMQANGTGGSVTIAATNLVVGPVATPTPLLKTSGVANLTSVTGVVSLENGGMIVATGGITLKPNGAINWVVNTNPTGPGSLNAVITAVNATGSPATISLPSNTTLILPSVLPAVTVPINFRGTNLIINGSSIASTTAIGLQLLAGASGSVISGVTFTGFRGTGVSLIGTQNTAISNIVVNGGSTGIAVSGTLTGSSVRGSTFNNNSTGISLVSAVGITVGGTLAGQANTINGAITVGVFASGFCTNSSVVKTVFVNVPTAKQYNVTGSRYLTVIQ